MTGVARQTAGTGGNANQGPPDQRVFLRALLDLLRLTLHADTATVFLVDPSSGQLVATAASGLEEEVYQGVRVPIGRGFAGRVAATGKPLILREIDHKHVISPTLLDKGLRVLAGVPLMIDGDITGVLHVGSLHDREFSSRQVKILERGALCAAHAVRAAQAAADWATADALHRSLAPDGLPALSGVEIAARYVPGDGNVGGDWYDVFVLPPGKLGLVIGDVAGTGLHAAVVMGRMRTVLRAYALESSDPAEVLTKLDCKMQHFEPDAVATVLYAVIEPGLDQMRISLAGHFPPVIAVPGKPAALATVGADPLIGADCAAPRHSTTISLPPNTALAFFTDGLVERRKEGLDDMLARLRSVVTLAHPEEACARVMRAMVGEVASSDDIALLMLRLRSTGGGGGDATDT